MSSDGFQAMSDPQGASPIRAPPSPCRHEHNSAHAMPEHHINTASVKPDSAPLAVAQSKGAVSPRQVLPTGRGVAHGRRMASASLRRTMPLDTSSDSEEENTSYCKFRARTPPLEYSQRVSVTQSDAEIGADKADTTGGARDEEDIDLDSLNGSLDSDCGQWSTRIRPITAALNTLRGTPSPQPSNQYMTAKSKTGGVTSESGKTRVALQEVTPVMIASMAATRNRRNASNIPAGSI